MFRSLFYGISSSPAFLTVSCTPSFVAQTFSQSNPTSISVTASASGGTGPYTYAWTVDTTLEGVITITTPALSSTTFKTVGLTFGEESSAKVRCTATDSIGNMGYIIINVSLERTGLE